jgi:septum formation protein
MNRLFFTSDKDIILASASPRRQAFLHDLGLRFTIAPASINETPQAGELPENFVCRMAQTKAETIGTKNTASIIIGADTIISFHGEILGKPKSPSHALHILAKLQGTSHHVITGLCLYCYKDHLKTTITSTTTVTFARFPKKILEAYIGTGEPLDKAGAYAIQGRGGFLVRKISGSCSNVIGLPMSDLVSLLLSHNIISVPGSQ